MTCIVGAVDRKNQVVYIGGDSASSNGETKSTRVDSKVFRVGEFIIGGSGSWRMIQLLKYSLFPHEVGDKDIFEYMCTSFINEVIRCFKTGEYAMIDREYGNLLGGTFLVGYKDRLFQVEEDFQVSEVTQGYDSVGCGSSIALGAMYALIDSGDPVPIKIRRALEASESLSFGVSSPFTILSTNE